MNIAITSSQPLRLLLIKTSSMGDLVHTLSALQEASRHRPGLSVDWVCEEAFVDVPPLSSALARVIPIAIRRWRHAMLSAATRSEIKAFVRDLRRERYDLVIDAQGLIKTAWITALARCPSGQKWGFDRASIREPLAGIALSHRAHAPSDRHAIERLRMLFAAALGYAMTGEPAVVNLHVLASPARPDTSRFDRLRSTIGDHRYVVLLHGTSRAIKSWPVEQWAQLAAEIAASGKKIILPWGSENEHAISQQIAAGAGQAAWVPPRLAIAEIAAMLMHADAMVGVDSGLMHLAAALGRPTVAVMPAGLSSRYAASRFAPPWTSHVRTVLPRRDGAMIEVAAVSQALSSVMSKA